MAKLAKTFDEFLDTSNFSIVLNTEGLYFLLYESKFREIVKNADLIFCDGIGLKFALNFCGLKKVKRLHGPDLFHKSLHQKHGKKQLIVGGSERSHELLLAKYSHLNNNPNLYFYSSMIQEDNLTDLFNLIDNYQPELIYVCLGIRKQEFIGTLIKERYPNCSIVGLGASIDFESGNVKRSSVFFQKTGLEWLPRLIREPRMLPRMMRSITGLLMYSFYGLFRIAKKNVDLISIVDNDNFKSGNDK